MATLSLRTLTHPATLAVFDPGVLHDLLAAHGDYLGRHGCHLPTTRGIDLDLEALSAALLADDPEFPADLADALATIAETGTDRHVAAIETAARRAGIDLGVAAGGAMSPMDLASRLWLAKPDLLKRIHAEASIPAVKRYESWRCSTDDIPVFRLPEDPEPLMSTWAADIDTHLKAHHFGEGTRIFVCPAGRLTYFLIRHGAMLQRVPVHHDDGRTASVVFRPAVTDVVRYDQAAGELGLHLQKHTKWLSEAIRLSFSLRIFSIPHLFYGERRYTLEPIQSRGEAAIDCAGHPSIDSVSLIELEIRYSDAVNGTITYGATDVFAFLLARKLPVGDQPLPTAAKLKFMLTDGAERTATIRAPNVAVYQRVGDDDVIGAFLQERGFVLAQEIDEHDEVA